MRALCLPCVTPIWAFAATPKVRAGGLFGVPLPLHCLRFACAQLPQLTPLQSLTLFFSFSII